MKKFFSFIKETDAFNLMMYATIVGYIVNAFCFPYGVVLFCVSPIAVFVIRKVA